MVPLIAFTNLSTATKATITAVVWIGMPKVFTLMAIFLLGEEGFRHLATLVLGTLKSAVLVQTPGPARHVIGMLMFLGPLLLTVAAPYLDKYLPGWLPQEVYVALIGDLVFALSFFVLGADFWDKLRALLVRGATVSFPSATRGE